MKMPKAKFKRKGAPPDVLLLLDRETKLRKLSDCDNDRAPIGLEYTDGCATGSILMLPEEMICMILQHLPVVTIARVEQTCKYLQTVIKHARIWRKVLLNIIEFEPGLADFIPELGTLDKVKQEDEKSDTFYKSLFCELKLKLDRVWLAKEASPSISR